MIGKILRAVDAIYAPRTAYAHCDIPCGIYETDTATHAADTVYVLTQKLIELKRSENPDSKQRAEYVHAVARMTETKEKFAQICKQELLVLWTDYFKSEHLGKYPDLHAKIWMATKQCSTAKREINLEAAQKLKEMVADIARLFEETKHK